MLYGIKVIGSSVRIYDESSVTKPIDCAILARVNFALRSYKKRARVLRKHSACKIFHDFLYTFKEEIFAGRILLYFPCDKMPFKDKDFDE